jgi:hypothetical protein
MRATICVLIFGVPRFARIVTVDQVEVPAFAR